MDAMRCLVFVVLCGMPTLAAVAAEGTSPAPGRSDPAAAVAPGIYRSDKAGPDSGRLYLILDERRAVLQNEHGKALVAYRMAREPDGLILFRVGKPTAMRVVVRGDGVTVVDGDGKPVFADLFALCPEPPEAIGWQPYDLPETDGDPDRRRAVAAELERRFGLEQRLRGEAIALMGGRMDEATMEKPEVTKKWQEVGAADEDNRAWLSTTLRDSGWIGRKTHGDKAHQAVLLVMLHNVADLRLAATALANMQAEAKRGEIGEASVANLADRFALTMGEPLTYGIQAVGGADGRPIIPIIADTARVDANRKRIGQPPLAKAAAMMEATVVRIDEDGRLAPGGLAKALVARATAPGAEDLARAVSLAKDLEAALARPDVERHPLAHTIADTLACVRYREGQLPAAAALWQKAMTLAGPKSPEVYRRRLAVAEAGDAAAPLPR